MTEEVKFIRGNDRISQLVQRPNIADGVTRVRAGMAEADRTYAMGLAALVNACHMPTYAWRASTCGSPAAAVLAWADTVRSGSAVDWLPGVPEAHPASPAAAQHARTAVRKVPLPPRNPGHLPLLAEPRR